MKEIHLIQQLFLQDGILKSKVGRSTKKVHYRQGDLDGACGAYSIAMTLNIIGAFDADFLNEETKNVDYRTSEGKMHKAIHEWGLYPNGLSTDNCLEILEKFKKKSMYKLIEAPEVNPDILKSYIDRDIPIILSIDYQGGGHWIVIIGYELKNGRIENFFTLDPGSELPSSAYWNGVINMNPANGKHYRYAYNAISWKSMVAISDGIAVWLK